MSNLPRLTSLSQLGPAKLAMEDVDVPELGVSVTVRELTGEQIERWKSGNLRTKGGKIVGYNLSTSTARLLAMAIVDDTGNPCFNEQDITNLMRTHGAGSIAKIEEVARRLSGLSDDDEDAEGNSSATSEPSNTDSL
jgi:hypothetical protein